MATITTYQLELEKALLEIYKKRASDNDPNSSPSAIMQSVASETSLAISKCIEGVITGVTLEDIDVSSLAINFSDIRNTPTTLLGYGITDALGLATFEEHTNNGRHLTDLQKDILDLFSIVDGKLQVSSDFYSTGEVSAFGAGSSGGSGGGLIQTVYGISGLSATYSDANLAETFNAAAIKKIYDDVVTLQSGSLVNYSLVGTGNAITNVSKTGNSLTFTKGLNFSKTGHTHSFGDISGLPTTLSGYGITDGVTTTSFNEHVNNFNTHVSSDAHLTTTQKNILSHLQIVDGKLQADIDFYSIGEVSAFGAGTNSNSGSGLIQTVYGYSSLGSSFNNDTLTDTFNAYTINQLHTRLSQVEVGAAINVAVSGTGNAVTGVTKNGNVLEFTKGLTFSLANHTHDYIPLSQKGTANGVASLDANGLIISAQLPSYVDDVIEVSAYANLPVSGESGKIYVTTDTNITYRWTGTTYVEISKSLALGETSSTAYRGDLGAIAYAHSQIAGGTGVHVSGTERTNWNLAYTNSHTHANKALLDAFSQSDNDVLNHLSIVDGKLKVDIDLYSLGEVSAFGAGSGTGGSGLIQTVYGLSGLGGAYSDATLTDTFNAYTINSLHNRINSLEAGSALNFATAGSGNAVTSVVKSGNVVTVTKGLTFSVDGHTHTFTSLTSKPSTLSGYGITDALLKSDINVQVGGTKNSQMSWASWNNSDGYGGAIQIREYGYVYDSQSDWYYSPAITFHWGNRAAKRFGMRSDGQFAIDDNPILWSGNYSAYALPLSGGTLSGNLSINTSLFSTATYLILGQNDFNVVVNKGANSFYPNNTSGLVDLGLSYNRWRYLYTDYLCNSQNTPIHIDTIWHSGNDGSGSGLDADTLDGYHNGDILAKGIYSRTSYNNPTDLAKTVGAIKSQLKDILGANGALSNATISASLIDNWNNESAIGYSSSIYNVIRLDCYGTAPYGQYLFSSYDLVNIKVAGVNNGVWTDIKTLAFTTDNVASATKLQTSRTIWGQSFDGTSDVNGDSHISGDLFVGLASSPKTIATRNIQGHGATDLSINPWGGNVSIGTTDANGYKLYVNGTGYFSSYLHVADTITGMKNTPVGTIYNQLGIQVLSTDGSPVGIGFHRAGYSQTILEHSGDGLIIRSSSSIGAGAYGNLTANLLGNASTATRIEATVSGTNTIELVRGNIADNDFFRILVGGTASNSGYAEIATADDGTEPIYVRQYSGLFASLVRTATLLDEAGNTNFPGAVTANRFYAGYDAGVANSISCSGWFYSMGVNGWFNSTYGGGIYMEDSTYVRVYNNKAFWVDNNIVATGEITAFGASDIRLKSNIKPINSALDFLGKVKTYEFEWNEKAIRLNPLKTKKGAGVIAQEMSLLDNNFVHSIYGDYLGVDYERFIPYLIGGVNEVADEVTILKKKVAKLEREIELLRA